MPGHNHETLELTQETARFGARRVVTGRVRISTETETHEALASGTLEGQTVEVERVPKNVYVDLPPLVRTEGELTVIPVLEEVLVVETRLLLVEEIHVRRVLATEEVETPVTLRRQRAIIERVGPETGPETADAFTDTQTARTEL